MGYLAVIFDNCFSTQSRKEWIFFFVQSHKIWIYFMNHITSHHKDSQQEQLFFSTSNPNIKLGREETVVQLQHLPEKIVYIYENKKTDKVGKSKCFFLVQILTENGMNSINSIIHITSKHKVGRSWLFVSVRKHLTSKCTLHRKEDGFSVQLLMVFFFYLNQIKETHKI